MLFTLAAKILSDGQFFFFFRLKKKWIEQKGLLWDRLNGLSFVKEFNVFIKQPMREISPSEMFTFKTHLDSTCKSNKGIWSHKRYYLSKMSRNHIHRTVTLHAIKVHCKVLFISKQRLGNFVELFENFKFLCLSVEFRNFFSLVFFFSWRQFLF